MPYVLFDNKAVRFGSPQLTIRDGRVFFNADAGDFLQGTKASFAHFLWDAAAFKLAIRPTAKKDARTFKISVKPGRRGGAISAQSFLKHIQWNGESAAVVPATWNEGEQILEAALPRNRIGTADRTEGAVTMEKKRTEDDVEEVRRAEMNRGRRPVDMETKRQRQELLRELRKLLDVASESEFVAAMRALGLPEDSPTLREVLEIWRQNRS